MKTGIFYLILITNLLFTGLLAQGQKASSKKAIATKSTGSPAYTIKARIKGLKDTSCFLAYHMGDKQYLADTAKVDRNGNMTFTGTQKLPGGIYMVVLPSRKYFEVLLNEPTFSLETDTADLSGALKFTGSIENQLFIDYLKFVQQKGVRMENLNKRYRASQKNADSARILRKQIEETDAQISDHRRQIASQQPNTFMAKLMLALTEPKRPEPPKAKNGRPDSAWKFYDQRAHYWDNTDFGDERLLRTPILLGKVKYYLENMYPQEPDSLIIATTQVLERTRANKEVFRYFLWYISNSYETNKFMGMDAVFTHVAGKYYLSKEVDWLDSTTRAKIQERVTILKPLLLGKPTPRLVMRDSNLVLRPIYDIKARYTVVMFYDPNCGHCQKEVPRLSKMYKDTLKAKGVEIYLACAERKPDDWRKFIRKEKLQGINVFDADTIVDFRKYWDVYSYPVIYVLDEEKKILAKRIGVEDINGLIDAMNKQRDRQIAEKLKK